jgi:hypothetical protein
MQTEKDLVRIRCRLVYQVLTDRGQQVRRQSTAPTVGQLLR